MKSGRIQVINGDMRSIVVAAPHGEHDKYTGEMVRLICKQLNAPGVIASDFVNPETGHRVNINRPTEGAGVDPQEESLTKLSAAAYHRYLKAVLKACGGLLDLYVEIHGNEHKELANRIEVATWEVPQRQARALKLYYSEMMNTHSPKLKGLKLKLWVEGINPIEKRAWANKLFGVLPLAKSSLHFELPLVAREDPEVRKETALTILQLIYAWRRGTFEARVFGESDV